MTDAIIPKPEQSATLRERLSECAVGFNKEGLVETLLSPYAPKDYQYPGRKRYLKLGDFEQMKPKDLSEYLELYMRDKGVIMGEDFSKEGEPNKLYWSFNPKQAKGKKLVWTIVPYMKVVEGIPLADGVDKDIHASLTWYEAVYFMAGLSHCRTSAFQGDLYTKEKLNAWSVQKIVAYTILQGIHHLNPCMDMLGGKELPHRKEIYQECQDIFRPQQEIVDKKDYRKPEDEMRSSEPRQKKPEPDLSSQLPLDFEKKKEPKRIVKFFRTLKKLLHFPLFFRK